MRLHRLNGSTLANARAGMVLCNDASVNGTRLHKGRVLEAGDIDLVRAAPNVELHLIELEAGELYEAEAGTRLAAAVAGDGVDVHEPASGHWPLVAAHRGVLSVSVDALRRANSVEGICVYTLFDGQVVDAGQTVARAKVSPLVLDGRLADRAVDIARETRGLVRVRAFTPRRIGVVIRETLGAETTRRFRSAFDEKAAWFGSTLLEPALVSSDEQAIGDALTRLVHDGADVLVVAGTKAMDPLDPTWAALTRAGIAIERFGVPAHPGNLFWLARQGKIPVLGMPACGLLSQATVFDIVLPRILAGDDLGAGDLADLGHGGLLTRELAFRFPPYHGIAQHGHVDD